MNSSPQLNKMCHVPQVEEKVDTVAITRRREIALTWAGIILTLAATFMVVTELAAIFLHDVHLEDWSGLAMHMLVATILAFLIYGGLVYQLARLAFIRRLRAHYRAARPDTESVYQHHSPSVCVLVPSYKEERDVVEMTLLSAALQDYPSRRVVLLLDDPPHAASADDAANLDVMRKLPAEIETLFAAPLHQMQIARAAFWDRATKQQIDSRVEYQQLSLLYGQAATWIQQRIDDYAAGDHAVVVFVDKVLRRHKDQLVARAEELQSLTEAPASEFGSHARMEREYNRLVGLFNVHLAR